MPNVWKESELKMGEYDVVPEADPKVTKQEFAYVEDKTNPKCSACDMFIKEGEENIGKCTLVKGDINGENGVCMFWAFRRTKPKEDKKYEPFLTKAEASYVETQGGTRCGTCKFRKEPDGCEMVEGQINMETGCCIAWMPDEETSTEIAIESDYNEIFKFFGRVY